MPIIERHRIHVVMRKAQPNLLEWKIPVYGTGANPDLQGSSISTRNEAHLTLVILFSGSSRTTLVMIKAVFDGELNSNDDRKTNLRSGNIGSAKL